MAGKKSNIVISTKVLTLFLCKFDKNAVLKS